MEEIDLDNIIGRRTRGRNIDFAKAAEELPEDEEDEDEDDDFQAPGENVPAAVDITATNTYTSDEDDEMKD